MLCVVCCVVLFFCVVYRVSCDMVFYVLRVACCVLCAVCVVRCLLNYFLFKQDLNLLSVVCVLCVLSYVLLFLGCVFNVVSSFLLWSDPILK